MASKTGRRFGDETQLVFGAGFAFGVTCALLLVAVLLASVDGSLGSPVLATTGGGVLFAAVIGAALYLLAFPENRSRLPIQTDRSDESDDSVVGDLDED